MPTDQHRDYTEMTLVVFSGKPLFSARSIFNIQGESTYKGKNIIMIRADHSCSFISSVWMFFPPALLNF